MILRLLNDLRFVDRGGWKNFSINAKIGNLGFGIYRK